MGDTDCDDIICEDCGESLTVVAYWRLRDGQLVYDGFHMACGCDEGEKTKSGNWRTEWFPESDANPDTDDGGER